MSISDIIILIVVGVCVFLAVRNILRSGKKGGCVCGCGQCSMCGKCGKQKTSENESDTVTGDKL